MSLHYKVEKSQTPSVVLLECTLSFLSSPVFSQSTQVSEDPMSIGFDTSNLQDILNLGVDIQLIQVMQYLEYNQWCTDNVSNRHRITDNNLEVLSCRHILINASSRKILSIELNDIELWMKTIFTFGLFFTISIRASYAALLKLC